MLQNSTKDFSTEKWQFWIDRGGTFTDIVAQLPDGSTRVHKLLSENPERYEDAPIQGIRELMGVATGEPIPAERISVVKMGTTVATNALLERKGDRTLFITTKGFGDGLRIGYQNRPDIFALRIILPDMLYEQVVEVDERMTAQGEIFQAITVKAEEQVRRELKKAFESGIRACAIAFLHGYRYPAHEQHIAQIAREVGFTQISTSHDVSPLIKWVSRGDTTVVDAYLSPLLRRYVDRIEQAFDSDTGIAPQLLFMQSNGGLTPAKFFQGKDSVLSGPAGGIVGAVQTCRAAGFDKIITFDMGGTSTDVAHCNGEGKPATAYERASETEVAGVRLRSPMMAIHTVAAGGGSILSFECDRYRVGPESAGAYPGPACYRNGGPLTVTDCNVMLGKIQPQFFPKVFGSKSDQPLDYEGVKAQFVELAEEISTQTEEHKSPEQVAEGFLSIAIDNMANAIKKISVQRGYDVGDYTLCCFGGAGGQHVCKLAENLGMKTVLIHPYAGVLSAYGMGLADRRVLKEASVEVILDEEAMDGLRETLGRLASRARTTLREQGDQDIDTFETLHQLHLRYEGTDSALPVDFSPKNSTANLLQQQFEACYQQQYGITLPKKRLIVATATAEVVGKTHLPEQEADSVQVSSEGKPIATVPLFSANQWRDTAVFQRSHLQPEQQVMGPAVVLETTGTNIIEPGWTGEIDCNGNLVLSQQDERVQTAEREASGGKPDPVRLEIFNNLFQAIAEQMGFTLQNTSSSVNIKERLDFSCAIFDSQGQLVANAPHIPVHLGSMGESVQALIEDQRLAAFEPGDVFISNNPYNGGTHLPDITAIAPVFIEGNPLFFVASRGHHADVGGVTPGSMPPHSKSLEQEGILFDNFLLVQNGELNAHALKQHLTNSTYPARNPDQNLADLQAQIAANNKGAQELQNMVNQYGLGTVQAYMQHVQNNAEQAIRKVIQELCHLVSLGKGNRKGGVSTNTTPTNPPLFSNHFQVPMDCGAVIQVTITLNPADNSAIIDFTNTSPQQPNNFNAPLAVCKAAVLYVFRTLVQTPIPLNAGCLKPLDIRVPEGSMLNPSYPAAVVAGNVETSQAITDALYGALGILAASQGTMNNFTFGNDQYQYYETICGGSGAGIDSEGKGFAGTDAVQTHMTNSRLTDPEVLELRFPVILKEFSIREGSGGKGKYTGGHGVVRRLIFREALTANILSCRRRTKPFGLIGGEDGKSGETIVQRADGASEGLNSTGTVEVKAGDSIVIRTPGGGGYERAQAIK